MKALFLPLLLLLSTASCQKDDDPTAALPAPTIAGWNTGGCLINGEAFVATASPGIVLSKPIPALTGGFYRDSYEVELRFKTPTGWAYLTLFLHAQTPGAYDLNQRARRGSSQYTLNGAIWNPDDASGALYVTDARHTGKLLLTRADKQRGISAGIFSFTAVSDLDSTKSITVTSGRFDYQQ